MAATFVLLFLWWFWVFRLSLGFYWCLRDLGGGCLSVCILPLGYCVCFLVLRFMIFVCVGVDFDTLLVFG